MGCTSRGAAPGADELREFAIAARTLASEAVLLMRRLGAEETPTPAASRAVEHATEAVAQLDRLTRQDAATGAVYRTAAWALHAAAVALGEAKQAHARHVRVVTARPPATPPPVGGAKS